MNDPKFQQLNEQLLLQKLKILQLRLDRLEGRVTEKQYNILMPIQHRAKNDIIRARIRHLAEKHGQPQSNLKTG